MKKDLDAMLLELELKMALDVLSEPPPGSFYGEAYGHTLQEAWADFMAAPDVGDEAGVAASRAMPRIAIEVSPCPRGLSPLGYQAELFAERQELIDNKQAFALAYRRPALRKDGSRWVNQAGQPAWWIFGMTAPALPVGHTN